MKIIWMLLLCLIQTAFIPFDCRSQQSEFAFDEIMNDEFEPDGPGGVVLIAKEGKTVYRKSFGNANLELGVAMRPDHIFRIGSITKQFTAAAILKLAEEGKLSLQDDITKFIKDYPTHGHTLTIEHLLTHTSGIKNYTGLDKWTPEILRKDFTPKELVDFFKDEPMDFAPGEDFRYSNSGYILLGYIIELISGKSYGDCVNEFFFKPLGMNDSYYDNASMIVSNRAPGYQHRNGRYENADFVSMTLPYSAGSLLSTADDLSKWYEAVVNNKVVSERSIETAHSSYKLANGRSTGYGYGWEIGNIQGSKTIGHVGRINGFVTHTLYIPLERIFVAVFSNCDCNDKLDVATSKMAATALGKPYQLDKRIKLSPKQMEAYPSVYKSDYEGEKIVAYEDGRLLFFNKGGSKFQLFPFEKDKFVIGNGLAALEFQRNAAGKITSFNLKGTGIPTVWIRTGEKIQTMTVKRISAEALDKYVGKYQFSPGPVFSIVKEGDKIYGQVGDDKKEILPFDQHKFFARDIDARLIFNVDRTGQVVGLTKIQNSDMNAVKVE